MRKVVLGVLLAGLVLVNGSIASASKHGKDTSAAHSINNVVTAIDYKVTEKSQKEIIDLMRFSYLSTIEQDESEKYLITETERDVANSISDYQDTDDESDKSELSDVAAAKAYLINNNIFSRREALSYTSGNGKWVAARYEDVKNQWNEIFVTKYNRYLNKCNSTSTKSEIKSVFTNFTSEAMNGKLITQMENTKMLNDKKKKALKEDVKKCRNQLADNLDATVKSNYYDEFTSSMEDFKDVFKKYYSDISCVDSDTVRKSDLLMLLYKSVWGSIASRPIVFNKMAVRNANTYSECTPQWWDGGKLIKNLNNYRRTSDGRDVVEGYWDTASVKGNADFTSGDYYYYLSNNVYELYFKALLDKGIIYKDEFLDDEDDSDNLFGGTDSPGVAFVKAVNKLSNSGVYPVWSNESGLCDSTVSSALGQSTKYTAGGSITQRNPRYFDDEAISYGEALEYIEDVLRLSEDDITKTEAGIIMYKYGITYLSAYTEKQQKTLSFLISKGILSFEDGDQYADLSKRITFAKLFQLLYRVANKDARYDFSKITLTDGESFWQDNGYGANEMPICSVSGGFVQDEGTAVKLEDKNAVTIASAPVGFDALLDSFKGGSGLLSNDLLVASAETGTWVVTKRISSDVDWKYGETKLKDLVSGSKGKPSEIHKITKTKMKYNNNKVPCYKVVFHVKAGSASGAIKHVEKTLKYPISAGTPKINAVTKVKQAGSGNPEYTMISQSSMKETWSKIAVIEDKVLVNTVTGAQAIILPDAGYALVGNTVIRTKDEFLMTDAGSSGEVYYNMKIIQSILEDSFVQKLGKGAIVTNSDTIDDYKSYVRSEYDAEFGKAVISNLKLTSKQADLCNGFLDNSQSSDPDANYQAGGILHLYNVNSITEGITTIVKDFKIKVSGKEELVTLVIDWKFAIPGVEDFESVSDLYDTLSSGDSKNELATQLYTRPEGSNILTNWWDSNYMASNMLCNYVYGTKGICYVNTGYLTPSLSILLPRSAYTNSKGAVNPTAKDKCLEALFKESGNAIQPQVWPGGTSEESGVIAKYFGSDYPKWYSKFYSADKAFEDVDLPDEEAGVLKAMVADYRQISPCYGRSKKNGDGEFFASALGQRYFRTASGVVYRDIDSDTRMEYDTNKSNRVSLIKMHTRTTSEATLTDGVTTVKIKAGDKEHKLRYVGQKTIKSVKSKKSKKYYLFVPCDTPIVRDVKDDLFNGGKLIWSGGNVSKDAIEYPKFVPFKDKALKAGKGKDDRDSEIDFGYVKLWDKWSDEYLGLHEHPYHFDYNYAFHFAGEEKMVKTWSKGFKKGEAIWTYDSKTRKTINKWKGMTNSILFGALNQFALNVKCKAGNEHKGSAIEQILDKNGQANYGRYRIASREELKKGDAFRSILKGGEIDNKSTLYAIPVFYCPVDEWSVYTEDSTTGGQSASNTAETECILSHHKSANSICFGNYYPYSITKSIQESIIANYVKTASLSTLKAGDMITIGDVRFFIDSDDKQGSSGGKWMTSVALRGVGARKGIRNAAARWSKKKKDETGFKSVVKQTFKDNVVIVDGKAFPLTNYILQKNKDADASGIQVGGKRDTKNTRKFGLVYTTNNEPWGYRGNKDTKIKKGDAGRYDMTCIRLLMNGDLRVRPINAEGTIFTLTSTAAAGVYGSGDNIPAFYSESLNYDDNQYADIGVSSARYNPSALFNSQKNKFMQKYQRTLAGDFRSLFLLIVTCIASYLLVMSWISYLAIHHAGLRILLEAIAAGPSRSAQKGFDLIKILTFGIYSLDNDPPLSRVFMIMMGCTIVIMVAINF